MVNNILTLCFVFLNFIGFSQATTNTYVTSEAKLVSNKQNKAECAYLSLNNKGNVVLSWVEIEKKNSKMFFAVFNKTNNTFNKAIEVTAAKGLSPHHESVPKVAFKKDGTVIVVFQKRTPTRKNRFAGALYYTQSKDEGNTWSAPQYLHTDTTAGIGRGFFDIATLSDGEVGAIWLDGKKKQRSGSTLMFSKTNSKGFQADMEIGQKTCQCCRTDMYVDNTGNINIAYRNIFNDSIRDMAYIISSDVGKSFSSPKRISYDNWIINGCPHTGPTMTKNNNKLQFYWFTMGGGQGVYNTSTNNSGNSFTDRKLFSVDAKHPQVISLNDSAHVLVWDEMVEFEDTYNSRIGVCVKNNNDEQKSYITPSTIGANYPVVIGLNNSSLLVAYTVMIEEKREVFYKIIK